MPAPSQNLSAIPHPEPSAKPAPKLEVVPKADAKPKAAKPVPARPAGRKGHGDAIAIVVSILLPLAVTAWGWGYYAAPRTGRLRHPLHALLKSSGPIGLGLGVVGLALFLFMWLYPFRKSVKWLAWTGPLGAWMRVHVVAGLAIPVIVAVHAGWRFDGLIGLGYLSMFVVSLSGIVGRYLYVHIPRSRNGLEMTMEDVANERRALVTNIAAATGMVPAEVERRLVSNTTSFEGLDPIRTLWRMVQEDVARGRTLRDLQKELAKPRPGRQPLEGHELRETMRLARRELTLSQQVRMLEATRRVFGYWHVAHRPFAITALVAVIVHVIVAMVVGGIGFPLGR